MGKKFVVRLTEQELATLLAKQLIDRELSKITGGKLSSSGLGKLMSKDSSSKESTSSADIKPTAGEFTQLDLNKESDYKAYEEIANKFISSRSSNLLGIKGSMLADAARNTFKKTGKYVPVELALAQLAAEGGFSKNPNARPIRTKNPFNVGNVDNGKNITHSSVQSGIQTYYDLIANRYLVGGKTASDLVNNFVNLNGNRYASSRAYEDSVGKIASQVKGMAEPVYASVKKKSDTYNV